MYPEGGRIELRTVRDATTPALWSSLLVRRLVNIVRAVPSDEEVARELWYHHKIHRIFQNRLSDTGDFKLQLPL